MKAEVRGQSGCAQRAEGSWRRTLEGTLAQEPGQAKEQTGWTIHFQPKDFQS